MTLFKIGVSRQTGEVMLFMEAPCGFKPIVGWHRLEGVREFADMLLDFYNSRTEERNKMERVSDDLLRQALGDR